MKGMYIGKDKIKGITSWERNDNNIDMVYVTEDGKPITMQEFINASASGYSGIKVRISKQGEQ